MLLAGVLLVASAYGHAAELGRARMLSGVGQPLRVELAIDDVAAGRTPAHFSLQVMARQASDGALADTVGLDVRTAVRERVSGEGELIAIITSQAAVNRPVVDLDVALTGPDGTQRRRVILWLPPSMQAAISPVALGRASQSSETILVRSGDTASSIARRLRARGGYDSTTMYQVLAALLQANPAAFIDGNLNGLRAGARLQIPDAAAVRAIDPQQARQLYAQHMREFQGYRGRAAGATPVASAPAAGAEASGRIAQQGAAPQPASGRDELRLSGSTRGAGAGQETSRTVDQLRDERAATQRALAEASARADELQANIQAMQKLLEVQNTTLARLQQQADDAAGRTGTPGAQGPAGAQGATGAQGPAGATGAAGTQGPAGATGAAGAQGPAGATGAAGAQGLAGASGAAGAQGLAGASGAAGAQGLAGASGAAGAQGPAGATGAAAGATVAGGVASIGGSAAGQAGGATASQAAAGAGMAGTVSLGQGANGASAGSANAGSAGSGSTAADAAGATSASDDDTNTLAEVAAQRYFWPIVALVLAFLVGVLMLVFRKKQPATRNVATPASVGAAAPENAQGDTAAPDTDPASAGRKKT